MERDIVILAKSDKSSHYCVAGKDVNSGEWIRLGKWIKVGDKRHFVFIDDEMKYSDGTKCEILDLVRVNCLDDDVGILHQPENKFIDTSKQFPLKKIMKFTWDMIIDKYMDPLENNLLRMPLERSRVNVDYRDALNGHESLKLIEAKNIIIYPIEEKHPKMEFTYLNYDGKELRYKTTLTDPEYKNLREQRKVEKAYLVMSVGEEWKGYYYLLAAKLIIKNPLS